MEYEQMVYEQKKARLESLDWWLKILCPNCKDCSKCGYQTECQTATKLYDEIAQYEARQMLKKSR